MARYGREIRTRSGRTAEGRGRRGYGAEYRPRGYDDRYRGGWGMGHLFATVMRGGPEEEQRSYDAPYRRPRGTPYSSDFDAYGGASRDGYGGGGRTGRGASERGSWGVHRRGDEGSAGVHYRGGRGTSRRGF